MKIFNDIVVGTKLLLCLTLFFFLCIKANTQIPGTKNPVIEVINIVEKDYPGFFILSATELKKYTKWKKSILQQAIVANRFETNILINEYLSFFRDAHLRSTYWTNDSDVVNFKRNIYINKPSGQREFIGFWFLKKHDILLHIKKEKNCYIGYVYKDLNGEIKRGVKYLEIYPSSSNRKYNLLFFHPNGYIYSSPLQYFKGNFCEGKNRIFMHKIYPRQFTKYGMLTKVESELYAKIIENNIFYLKIPSFFPYYKNQIDSLLRISDNRISNTRVLLVDIRGNSGGTIGATMELLKYIKTGPIRYYNSYTIASDSVIYSYKRICASNENDGSFLFKNYCNKFLPQLIANKGKLVFDSTQVYLDTVPNRSLPAQVGILIDDKTGSAAELFLLAVIKSKKVKIFGENSAGGVDFGGVIYYLLQDSFSVLKLPTEVSEYIKEKRYDGIGITPDVPLKSDKKTWVNEVVQYYKREKAN